MPLTCRKSSPDSPATSTNHSVAGVAAESLVTLADELRREAPERVLSHPATIRTRAAPAAARRVLVQTHVATRFNPVGIASLRRCRRATLPCSLRKNLPLSGMASTNDTGVAVA